MFLELSLNGSWKIKGFSERNGEEMGAYRLENPGDGWLPAQVPGTNHTDLMENNAIPDPFRRLNEKKVQWVAESEWWYRKEIELPPGFLEKQVIELVFEGLDTYATVWVNGVKVGEANNMFTPWHFNIKSTVKAGKNVIAVRFKSIYKAVYEMERKHKHRYACLSAGNCSARPFVRKAQYSFGWDWAPTLPTSGIWRKTKIIAYDKARLGYFAALPIEVSVDKAKIKLIAEIHASKPSRLNVKFSLKGFGQKIEREISVEVAEGRNFIDYVVDVLEPKLWWPRGYGKQYLYDASAELYFGSEFLGEASANVGIRRIELLQEPDAEGISFVLKVNGLRIFCKGANWVPADSFLPRVSLDRYRQLLGLAVEANINMIRVWAGGIYEADEFYDLCDALGIMVWQDFMYVCAGYPEEEWFLKEAKRETEETVLRLRGHPCIMLWCGNNENQWLHHVLWKNRDQVERLLGLPIYDVIIPEVCRRLDSTRPYRPSTPYGGVDFSGKHEGHRHNWEVWSHGLDYIAYLEDKGRFLTEFGWQAPPTMKLLTEYMDKPDLHPNSEAFRVHEKQIGGLDLLKSLLAIHYPVPEDMRLFVLYSQLNQGEALKTAVTHWRSRMFRTSGCLIWQFNDCWPAISWSLIDYGLNSKAAYFFVKRAFQPIIAPLIIKEGKAHVYIVNETEKTLESTLSFQVMTFTGEIQHNQQAESVTPAYTSNLILQIPLDTLPLRENCILVVTLESKGTLLYEESKTVREPKDPIMPTQKIKTKTKKLASAKFEVMLKSNVYAKAVWLGLEGLKGEFSDNFFDLLPNRQKTVECDLEKDTFVEDFKRALSLEVYPYTRG